MGSLGRYDFWDSWGHGCAECPSRLVRAEKVCLPGWPERQEAVDCVDTPADGDTGCCGSEVAGETPGRGGKPLVRACEEAGSPQVDGEHSRRGGEGRGALGVQFWTRCCREPVR